MRWDAIAAPDLKQDLILFDGDCVLCSRAAHFVHHNDSAERFKFVAIQSPFGRNLAARFGIDPSQPQTNLALVEGRAYFKSDAALSVLRMLPGWRWTSVAFAFPKSARDWIYDRIARNRYHLFGWRERCWVGEPAFHKRIIETFE